jgi:anti-sigma regulatory factor (Ser/Thr protein kinase)
VHEALLYRDLDDFVAGAAAFLRAGLAADEPAMAAVPEPRLDALRDAVGQDVRLVDMTGFGRNPARIIPALRDWVDEHPGRRLRFVGEPIWPERRAAETIEATRHEALLNVAFADAPVDILCPYDAARLDPAVLADAERTHPMIVAGGTRRPSSGYASPEAVYAVAEQPLPDPAGPVHALAVTGDLARLRRFVAEHAAPAGIAGDRLEDLQLAITEAAANTIRHAGGGPGTLRVWRDARAFVCEVADGGRIADPLAGRRRPSLDATTGRGLWLINQLCDLVELRQGPRGTTLRLHMDLG